MHASPARCRVCAPGRRPSRTGPAAWPACTSWGPACARLNAVRPAGAMLPTLPGPWHLSSRSQHVWLGLWAMPLAHIDGDRCTDGQALPCRLQAVAIAPRCRWLQVHQAVLWPSRWSPAVASCMFARARQAARAALALRRGLADGPGRETNIYIDRSGLIQWKDPKAAQAGAQTVHKEPATPLAEHLKALVQACRAALRLFRLAQQQAPACKGLSAAEQVCLARHSACSTAWPDAWRAAVPWGAHHPC